MMPDLDSRSTLWCKIAQYFTEFISCVWSDNEHHIAEHTELDEATQALRWDIPIVCYKYHKNEAESQSEHN